MRSILFFLLLVAPTLATLAQEPVAPAEDAPRDAGIERAAIVERRGAMAPQLDALGFLLDMPGESHIGPLPATTRDQVLLSRVLKADVEKLALGIGERHLAKPGSLDEAAAWIEARLRAMGFEPTAQAFEVEGQACRNIAVEIAGGERAEEIVVVGAHYDSVPDCPGANDNGSGVAACLALAERFAKEKPARTLRFLFFANEEPPHFRQPTMGSVVYANACAERAENVVAMLSLETMGYYSDEAATQEYPTTLAQFFPSTGDFIAFVANKESVGLLRDAVGSFRRAAAFPSEGLAGPSQVPGIGWSDQWSFWRAGYPAIMATDTAPFRYPWYHTPGDKPDKLDFERLARVVEGLEAVVRDLANAGEKAGEEEGI